MSWKETELVKITDDGIRERIECTLCKLWENDAHYFLMNVNEVTITNRLSCYLIPKFNDYDVDAEYNRYNSETKMITREDGRDTIVKPDIIIHQRGSQENNFLVIEAKKSTNSEENKIEDENKLQAYKEENLSYIHAVYIEFNTGESVTRETFVSEIKYI